MTEPTTEIDRIEADLCARGLLLLHQEMGVQGLLVDRASRRDVHSTLKVLSDLAVRLRLFANGSAVDGISVQEGNSDGRD